jgi:hypothetical protein
MTLVNLEHLKALVHLDLAHLNGRNIPFHALHDGTAWRLWVPGPQGLFEVKPVDASESSYFATAKAAESDFHSPFLEFFEQRAYWPDITRFIDGIGTDLLNLSACFAKIELIFHHCPHHSVGDSRMITTEIEYVFLTCRGIFDLLQEIMHRLWKKITLIDQTKKKAELPEKTYRKVVLQDDHPRTSKEIADRFVLPIEIANVYAKSTPFFFWLRDYRDLIAHSGHTPGHVYRTEQGFAISKEDRPFRDMEIWCDANSGINHLGSVLAVVAHIIQTTFGTCDEFAAVLQRLIQFPPPVAPNHRIFTRGAHTSYLNFLADMVAGTKAWYAPPTPTVATPPAPIAS